MKLTQQYITDLFIQAHAADRTHDHRKEIERAQSLQALYNRQNGIGTQLKLHYPVEKVQTKGYKASSVEDAVQAMERFFGKSQ